MTDSYPTWFEKNRFKNILAITDSNKKKKKKKNKIGEFKFIDIKTWFLILKLIQFVKYLLKKI